MGNQNIIIRNGHFFDRKGTLGGAKNLLTLIMSLLFVSACGDGVAPDATPPVGSGEILEIQIEAEGLVFDARVAGPENGERVLLLHGFPSTSWEWKHELETLGLASYRAVAPNQRGYSPGARPSAIEDYDVSNLVLDALNIADALGWDKFHLVGHDWGATVAWSVAVAAPDRLLTLNTISAPHPDAFAVELANPGSCQTNDSAYFNLLIQPGFENVLVANDSALLRAVYEGVPSKDVDVHIADIGNVEAMRAALNWYRASASSGSAPLGSVLVPTMFVWSDEDAFVCREGAEATGDYIDARYRFEIIEGVNHWVPELAGPEVSALLLDHFGSSPLSSSAPISTTTTPRR